LEPEQRFLTGASKYGDGFINAVSSAVKDKALTPEQVNLVDKLADLKIKSEVDQKVFEQWSLIMSRLAWVLLKSDRTLKARAVLDRLDLNRDQLSPEARSEIAGVLTEAHRFKEAIKLLDNPKTDEERLAIAKLYTGAREWKTATDILQGIVNNKPPEPTYRKARVMLADVLSYKGEHQAAIKMFDTLAMDYPNDKELPVRLAEVTLWSNQYQRALELFQKLYDLNPTENRVWSGYASAIDALGRFNHSKKIVPLIPTRYVPTLRSIADKVIAANPADAVLMARLGVAMHYIGEPAKAEQFASRAIELKPHDPVERREIGNLLGALKKTAAAFEMFANLDLTPDDRRNLIGIAVFGDQLDVAVREARFLVNLDRTNKVDKRVLAEVLSWRGEISESLAHYEEL
jgi:Flp pilus assembly protein TadD